MKLVCKECKTVIQMADTDTVAADIAAKMQDHVKREHTKPVDVLSAIREKFSLLLAEDVSKSEGDKIVSGLCGLLNLPVPSHFSEGEKIDATDSSIPH